MCSGHLLKGASISTNKSSKSQSPISNLLGRYLLWRLGSAWLHFAVELTKHLLLWPMQHSHDCYFWSQKISLRGRYTSALMIDLQTKQVSWTMRRAKARNNVLIPSKRSWFCQLWTHLFLWDWQKLQLLLSSYSQSQTRCCWWRSFCPTQWEKIASSFLGVF